MGGVYLKELIGKCFQCEKEVYCENGFFNGEQVQGKLFCPECAAELNNSN